MSVFKELLKFNNTSTTRAWVECKLKSSSLSYYEMAALGRRIKAVLPTFDQKEGLLMSASKFYIYTPMRLRSYLFPISFWLMRRLVSRAISDFRAFHDCDVRNIQIKHVMRLPKSYSMPLRPIEDIDLTELIEKIEQEAAPVSIGKRIARVLSYLKKVV